MWRGKTHQLKAHICIQIVNKYHDAIYNAVFAAFIKLQSPFRVNKKCAGGPGPPKKVENHCSRALLTRKALFMLISIHIMISIIFIHISNFYTRNENQIHAAAGRHRGLRQRHGDPALRGVPAQGRRAVAEERPGGGTEPALHHPGGRRRAKSDHPPADPGGRRPLRLRVQGRPHRGSADGGE